MSGPPRIGQTVLYHKDDRTPGVEAVVTAVHPHGLDLRIDQVVSTTLCYGVTSKDERNVFSDLANVGYWSWPPEG